MKFSPDFSHTRDLVNTCCWRHRQNPTDSWVGPVNTALLTVLGQEALGTWHPLTLPWSMVPDRGLYLVQAFVPFLKSCFLEHPDAGTIFLPGVIPLVTRSPAGEWMLHTLPLGCTGLFVTCDPHLHSPWSPLVLLLLAGTQHT